VGTNRSYGSLPGEITFIATVRNVIPSTIDGNKHPLSEGKEGLSQF
jgi:hypothetical protein